MHIKKLLKLMLFHTFRNIAIVYDNISSHHLYHD